jgi:LuxR family glucitol operon transcriptional activator
MKGDPMTASSDDYNIAAIRNLLKDAFTANTLWRFCQERADFQPVLFEIGRNAGLAEMIDVLLEHCRTEALFDELITAIREANPRQYGRYETQIHGSQAALPFARQVPHNLPPRSEFVGREAEKARIHDALRSRYFLISIDGIGGIGKTSLALEVVYECLDASQSEDPPEGIVTFDSFVWTTAKDRDLTLNAILDTIALTLDYPGIVQRPLDQKRIGVEKLLREKSCLLLVDNYETVADNGIGDFLYYLPEPSKALITTRVQKLGHVWAISLMGLEELEAVKLIHREGQRLGLASIRLADSKTLLYLHEATGGVPLAIKWSIGQIKQRGQSFNRVLTALHEARGSIFEDIFARSWSLLLPETQQVLVTMPIFATSATREAIEAASNVDHFVLDNALGQLSEMSLVDATDQLDSVRRRYSVHPLTRAFATRRLQQEPELERGARKRLADYYRAFSEKYSARWFDKGFVPLELELPNILVTIQWCWDNDLTGLGMEIFRDVSGFMNISGYWNDVLALGHQVLSLATEMNDELNAARFRVWPLGWVYRHRGDLDIAERHLSEALTVLEKLDKKRDIANAKRNLGRIAHVRGHIDRAERLLTEASELFESVEDKNQVYWITANLADVVREKGDLDSAWALGERALVYAREADRLEYSALFVLGKVANQRGDRGETKKLWEESLKQMRHANHLDAIADTSLKLAQLEIEAGNKEAARQMLSEALDTYRRLDMHSEIEEIKRILAGLSRSTDDMEPTP